METAVLANLETRLRQARIADVALDEPLAHHCTMRVGGKAALFATVHDAGALAEAVMAVDEADVPLLILGSGSNLVICDDGFDGCVVHPETPAICLREAHDGRAHVTAWAGTAWDDLVSFAVDRELAGIEALSGIPGLIGSAVMQNLGAYGQEVGACLENARLLDRATGEARVFEARELGMGYRTSMLRSSLEEARCSSEPWFPSPRWVVLEATFLLEHCPVGEIAHPQLARALSQNTGAHLELGELRRAVLAVRQAKGMVADPDPTGPHPDYDRWSSGSFFTNPILAARDADRVLPADAPRYPTGNPATVKTSAAWLIEHAGFPKGYGLYGGKSTATLSTLHTLALTNRGSARAADILELARAVRDGVLERFSIELAPESVIVGARI